MKNVFPTKGFPFVYRDKANLFNLYFRIHLLDVKQLFGCYLYEVRKGMRRNPDFRIASAPVSYRNIRYVETCHGTSMEAIIALYLYYDALGALSPGQRAQFADSCRMIWRE